MSKELPYFRWYPADAETDELYSSLNDLELGFFHRCLNRSWRNTGLPADLDKLARAMKVTRKYLDRVWPMVAKLWYTEGDRVYNRRQEEERTKAIKLGDSNRRDGNANARRSACDPNANQTRNEREKNANAFLPRLNREQSEREKNATDSRFEREENANQTPRAHARADSVCVYESDSVSDSSEIKEASARKSGIFPPRFHDWLSPWPRTGNIDLAAQMWVSMDADMAGDGPFACRDRYLASSEVVERNAIMDPAKFIDQQGRCAWSGKWPLPKTLAKNGDNRIARRDAAAAEAIRDLEEGNAGTKNRR